MPDGTTSSSAALVPLAPVFSNTERLALAGFLAGYSGLTRQAYEPCRSEVRLRRRGPGVSASHCFAAAGRTRE